MSIIGSRAWSLELYLGLLSGVRCTLGTQSREIGDQVVCGLPSGYAFRIRLPSTPFGYLRRHVPPVSCDQLLGGRMILNLFQLFPVCVLYGFFWEGGGADRPFLRILLPSSAFRPSSVYSFELPFPLPPMSSGSQSAGDPIVPKFDMHIYTSVQTVDEVNSLVKEYAIPLDLRPCVPPSTPTMNNLPRDKIGYHSVFKDGEGNGNLLPTCINFSSFPCPGVRISKGIALAENEAIAQHTTAPLPFGSQIPKKYDYQKVVEHEDERVLTAKRKAQAAKDKDADKRSAAEGTSQRTKRKKLLRCPLLYRNPNQMTSPVAVLHSALSDEDTHANSGEDGLYHDERDKHVRKHASGSTCHVLSSSSSGSGRQVFPSGTLVVTVAPYEPMSLNDDYGELYQSHRSCQDVSDMLIDTQNQLVDVIRNRNILSDDHKILQQEHLGCVGKEATLIEKLAAVEKEKDELFDKNQEQEEQIRRLEEALASKMPSLSKAESTASVLKGDLERLTVDLIHAEIVRHNYVRQLLPTVVRRLLSSEEYKKSLSDVFNQAIAAGWSEGMKVERSDEDAEAILVTAADYDPECKSTFMSAFDALFVKSYPYVKKLAVSFRLPLGDLQNMWPKGEGPTVGSSAVNA
ncbi:hypothetical protein Tco_1383421 [Tanacetum coccineum]